MMKTIKGKNLEEQMSHLDKIIPRLIRQGGNKVVGMVTPVPIAGYTDSDANSCKIISFLIPSKGKISLALVRSTVKINLLIEHVTKTTDTIGTIAVPTLKADVVIKYELDKGDVISVSAACVKNTDKLSKVWITLLWVPESDQVELKRQLIDNIEGILDET